MNLLGLGLLQATLKLAVWHPKLHWPLKPKHHAFQELNQQMLHKWYNPRFYHTFQDEDTMGAVKDTGPRSESFEGAFLFIARNPKP